MWHNNKSVLRSFSSHHSKNAWAQIQDLGWRKIQPYTTSGTTNVYMMMNAARANGRVVNVHINDDNQIDIAYLR